MAEDSNSIQGPPPAPAASASPQGSPRISSWNGYEREDFEVNRRPGIVVRPKEPAPGNPWIWRTEFFDAFPQADIALLAKGYHVAYMNNSDLFGAPEAIAYMDAFYDFVCKTYSLNSKPVLEGFSRGGLYAFNWAAHAPDKVSSLYVDAPVCDIRSWPGGKGKGQGSPPNWELCKKAYGLTEEQAVVFTGNPIDHLAPLAKAKIPIIAVAGDADKVVPIEENIRIVERRYKDLGGEIKLIVKPGADHHPHSLLDPTPIVDFILQHQPS